MVRVTLEPAGTLTPTAQPTTQASPPGSEHGWIAIHANVEGATVTVGSNTVGTIRNGVLRVSVATTGTPYSEFTVSKPRIRYDNRYRAPPALRGRNR